MKKSIYTLLCAALLISACSQPRQEELTVQQMISLDYAAIRMQIDEIQAELCGDSLLDEASPRYRELMCLDDSLQTALFERYQAADLRTWAEEHADLLGAQYESFLLEVEDRETK